MAEGIVEQVADHPNDLALVAANLPGRDAGDAHGCVADNLLYLAEDHIVQVDRLPADPRVGSGASVTSGEQQEVLDQVLHAKILVEDLACDLTQQLGVVASEPNFEFVADHRDRGAQLVGGVGDEMGLGDIRRLQPVEHGVHRSGEAPDLVAGGGLGHPAVQVAASDVGDLRADRFHGAQRAIDDEPGDHCDECHQHRQADHQRTDGGGGDAIDVLEVGANDDRILRGALGEVNMDAKVLGVEACHQHGDGGAIASCDDALPPGHVCAGSHHLAVGHIDDLDEIVLLVLHRQLTWRGAVLHQRFDVLDPYLQGGVDRPDLRGAQLMNEEDAGQSHGDRDDHDGPNAGSDPKPSEAGPHDVVPTRRYPAPRTVWIDSVP